MDSEGDKGERKDKMNTKENPVSGLRKDGGKRS